MVATSELRGRVGMSMVKLVDVLEERLRQLGVSRVYGAALGRLHHINVGDPDLAVLLADADGRLGHRDGSGRLGAAFIDGPLLHLSSKPGGTAVLEHVTSPSDIFDLLADPPGIELPGTLALDLDLDLDRPVTPTEMERRPLRPPVITLDPAMASLRIVLLVGTGVVRSSVVEEVRDLARHAGWGVVSTWGARGVERWDSPFDLGTVGLQERDVELSGLLEADVVVTSGVDPDELAVDVLASRLVQDVPPRQLAALLKGWKATRAIPERSSHYDLLRQVLVPLYESDVIPLTPPRATLHMSGALPDGGVVIGSPGPSGFWLARSFPTSAPESLCVPATSVPGFVAAAALVCAVEGRPYLAVMDQLAGDPIGVDDATSAVISLAEQLGVHVVLQLWGADGNQSISTSTDHVELTRASLEHPATGTYVVPVETSRLDDVTAVLGKPTVWGGPRQWSDPLGTVAGPAGTSAEASLDGPTGDGPSGDIGSHGGPTADEPSDGSN